jgi:Holliday junction resolvase RusA-like endonuclease
MMAYSFSVTGDPKTAGSKKGFPVRRANGTIGVTITDSVGKAGKDWRKLVQTVAKQEKAEWQHNAGLALPMDHPCRLSIVFSIRRPKCHYRANGTLRPDAPSRHTQKPDVLKLTRAIEDALTGIAWNDDAQIVEHTMVRKEWYNGATSRTSVVVEYIEVGE